MRRRDFISLFGGTAAARPFTVRSQQRAMPVIGFLHGPSRDGCAPTVAAFRKARAGPAIIGGRNVAIEYRRGSVMLAIDWQKACVMMKKEWKPDECRF